MGLSLLQVFATTKSQQTASDADAVAFQTATTAEPRRGHLSQPPAFGVFTAAGGRYLLSLGGQCAELRWNGVSSGATPLAGCVRGVPSPWLFFSPFWQEGIKGERWFNQGDTP